MNYARADPARNSNIVTANSPEVAGIDCGMKNAGI
jgi:hypothetical protein